MSKNHFAYRPDIDGLRAVAVILVLLFHISPGKYPSGFVGVDVFFVISGYLISSIILGELNNEKFSIKNFYIKRVKRIFPSLLVVMLTTIGLGMWILNPLEIQSLLKHLGSGSFFISNIALWLESGYFDSSSELKPLLHFWSLSIEEQFYIFWPLLLGFFFKRNLKISYLLGSLILISFGINIYFVKTNPSATFYLLHTRTWELLIGAMLAYQEFNNKKISFVNTHMQSFFGVLLLFSSIVLIDEKSIFPGYWALLPIIGTYFLISAGGDGYFNKNILAKKWIVFVGLISYPLYLWHWPLLSFLRIIESGDPSRLHKNLAVVLSFLFAYLTYKFIEIPVRKNLPKDKENIFVLSLTIILFATGISSFIAMNQISIDPLPAYERLGEGIKLADPRDFEVTELRNKNCQIFLPDYKGEFCLLSKNLSPEIAILGDSHAHSLYEGVSGLSNRNILLLGESACAPFYNTVSFPERDSKRCLKEINTAIDTIASSSSIKTVILHFRANTYTDIPNFVEAFDQTINKLKMANKKVIFIHQIPELSFSPKTCVDLHKIRFKPKNDICVVKRNSIEDAQLSYRKKVTQLKSKFLELDPLKVLCDAKICFAKSGNEILYRDDNHLNKKGSFYLIKKLEILDL